MSNRECWRFLDTPALGPAQNMAIDEAILLLHGDGKVPPTIRFYTWQPATLSIGYFQQLEREIDVEAVNKAGLGLVRRITGGRAVLHDQELTYSVIVSESHPSIPESVTEAYRVLSTGLLQGFRRLGLNAHFAVPQSEMELEQLRKPRSSVCFDSSSWYELVVEGRKIAGSAQTRQRGVVLQHGSILLDLDVELLFSLFRYRNQRLKERAQALFMERAVTINQVAREPLSLEAVKQAFKQGFAEAFDVELIDGKLTEEEAALADRLVKEKYDHAEWTFRR